MHIIGRSLALALLCLSAFTAAAGQKYHPGNYIALNGWDRQKEMLDALRPGVVGVAKRYSWALLEPTQGNYNFATVQADLDLLATKGAQLVLLVEDKSFAQWMPTPPYMAAYTIPNRSNGYVALRWKPFVVERYTALLVALGKRFDGHPAYEGLSTSESALSLDDPVLRAHGYTPELYRDSLIAVLNGASASMTRAQVFWYMNFLTWNNSYLAQVAAAVAPSGVVMGGPDVLPDNPPLVRLTYPLYPQFADRMVLFGSMQYNSYRHAHATSGYATKYWTPDEMFRFARDNLHVSYIFWTREPVRKYPDSYIWLDALPVIAANQGFNPLDETDFDGDGLILSAETALCTNPSASDTDGDGVSDGQEVTQGRDPLNPRSK